MSKTIYNPYLPAYEYVPDGEPHIFNGRLFIYGSHDRFGGTSYCEKDYVTWSAPLDDLSAWTNHGVIFRQVSDPDNHGRLTQLWAPDVCQGPDGKYYMYYCAVWSAWIGVAVSDRPEGPFQYLGKVKYPNGRRYGTGRDEMPFDPAVFVDDDGRIYLYTAFCRKGWKNHLIMKMAFHVNITGKCSYVLELEKDMMTVRSSRSLIPGPRMGKGTSFEGHEFYEASSLRKYNGTYYFIYSSVLSHELAYATSRYPDRDFVFRGVLHSNGNIGFRGQAAGSYPWGNNHGSIVKLNDGYYVFAHRQTNYSEYSRQGVAEKLVMDQNGLFSQAEMTSFGLSDELPEAKGMYPASIACVLTRNGTAGKVTEITDRGSMPMVTQREPDGTETESQYITNVSDGSLVGYRYFSFSAGRLRLALKVSGDAQGRLTVLTEDNRVTGEAELRISGEDTVTVDLEPVCGKHALLIRFSGVGHFDLYSFTFEPASGRMSGPVSEDERR